MKVLVKRVGEPAEVVEIPESDGCEEYRKLIGCKTVGGVTMPKPFSDVYLCCDDDGKLKGLKPNFLIPEYRDVIVGTAVFVGIGRVETVMPDGEVIQEDDFVSLNPVYFDFLKEYCAATDFHLISKAV